MSDIEEKLMEIFFSHLDSDMVDIAAGTNVMTDLGIDSVDFLDVTYDIERALSIKIPIVKWMESVNEGAALIENYFEWNNFVLHIQNLCKEKSA